MPAESILQEAERVIGDRAKQYGSPRESLDEIARLWTAYLAIPVAAEDVAVLMTLLKLARLRTGGHHRDSLVDAAGYVRVLDILTQEDAKPDVVRCACTYPTDCEHVPDKQWLANSPDARRLHGGVRQVRVFDDVSTEAKWMTVSC